MPLVQTRGAASAQGFGEFAQATVANYIEEMFSTYLYTGNGSTQTITNGIDLSTNGGIVWCKGRSPFGYSNVIYDTINGVNKRVATNLTNALTTATASLTAFNTTGFSLGADVGGEVNENAINYVSWSLRKQPKFFDVVTYSGTGANRTIAHNLGSVPGCIIVKRTDTTAAWAVYHRSLANTQYLVLNTTAAVATGATWWNSTTPTSAVFSVGTDASVNASGGTYVAYLFAHNAGGFGLAGTDNVISCGTLTGSGAGVSTTVTLGYEPQFIIAKRTDAAQNWVMFDNMRGFDNTNAAQLFPNLSNAESVSSASGYFTPTATGFKYGPDNYMGDTANIIYIAIRRGPMKVPTLGTSVFDISTVSTASGPVPGPTPTDMTLNKPSYNASTNNWRANDRLRGGGLSLFPNTTDAESSENYVFFDYQSGLRLSSWPVATAIWYNFQRAPGFFDEVCYTGTGANLTLSHNLTVAPQLMIVKRRSDAQAWSVGLPTGSLYLELNLTTQGYAYFGDYFLSAPTSSVFYINSANDLSVVGNTYVAYLFATLAGVSKVFSYTGNGSSQTINCGFTGGSRFVMIKRTDSTGDWYVWDSARGIVAGNDPHLSLNTTAAEVTTDDSVDTDNTGFVVNQLSATNVNVTSATYIGLAIA